MKKIINYFLLCLLMAVWSNAVAQTIPIDPDIRKGTLDNGLTYYIKHNVKPEKKVELRLVVKAGSILEDDDQQGLAHFMEHMNFNGTKHFPKNELVDYLQSIGVRFGNDLNAYTSFDETVYMLPIPLDKPDNLLKGLQVIEDWGFNALLTDEDIDKERGVILEELRLGLGAFQRIRDKLLPVVLKDSRYAERLPIGKKEILETFPHDALRRFYKDWYRPDLMTVVVVGDINVDDIEKYVKEHFGKYKNPASPRPRTVYEVPDHAETFVAEATDREMSFSQLSIDYYLHGTPKISTVVADYHEKILEGLLFSVINNRLQELADSPDPPFTQGYVYKSLLVLTKENFSAAIVTTEGKQLDGMKVVLREIERAKRYGITQGELERAKENALSSMERSYNDRDKTESGNYAEEFIRNFLNKESIPGMTWEYNQYREFLPSVTLEQINAVLGKFVKDENRVVTITGPEKEGLALPGESDILAVFDDVKNENLTAYEDKVAIKQLVTNLPAAGKIKKKKTDKKLGTTTWTLSNGATVVIKKTDFKNDEISFTADRKGGVSLLSDADYRATQWTYTLLDEAGLNGYNKTDLAKYLSGKQAGVSPFVRGTAEGLSGSATPKDLPTLMELIYAYFTGLNYSEASYQTAIKKMSSIYDNLLLQPEYYFLSEFSKFINKNNPRYTGLIPTSDVWKTQDFAKAYKFAKDRFSNAGDFTFYFVGNVDEKQLKDLAEKYIATLPASKTKETFKDDGYRDIYTAENQLVKKGQDPKSHIIIVYSGEMSKFDKKEEINFSALREVIDIKMVEILREKESGVYTSGVNDSYEKTPYNRYSLTFQIPTGPEQAQKMTDATLEIVRNVIENGPEQKDVDKFKEESLNQLRDDLKTNGAWMEGLRNYNINGGDKYRILKLESLVKSVTPQSIQKVARKYLTENNRIIATLMPEDGWEAKAETSQPAEKADISAQTVIDNYEKALGGKAKLAGVKTVYAKGTVSMMGMELQVETKKMAPNKSYVEMTMGGQKAMVMMFDGKKGFMEQMGNRQEMPAEMAAKQAEKQLFDIYLLKTDDIQSVESVAIDGKDCYLLTNKSGKKSFFDKSTGLLYRQEDVTPADASVVIIKNYRDVEGIKFPVEIVSSAMGQENTTKFTTVEFNRNVSENDFK